MLEGTGMRGASLLVLALAVAACGGAPDASAPLAAPSTTDGQGAVARPASPFASAYAAAAAESGVPADVLRGIAQAQTAEHVVAESEAGQFGLMGLTEATIAEVAPHIGATIDQVKYDTAFNVRAAAWIVADARARGESWNEAALEVPRFADARLRASWLLKFNHWFEAVGTTLERVAPDDASVYMDSADYGPAYWVPAYSGNYTSSSRTHTDLYYVVIHDVEGSYEGAISWFQNPSAQVSAHFVTSNEGDITQMVKIKDIAWHAGNWDYNVHSVGIEHEGYASDPNSYPETMYEASAALTSWLCDTYFITRDRAHIMGHVEVPGSTHHDPGPYWDWDHYMELVNGGVSQSAKLVGYVREGDIYTGTPIEGATVTIDGGLTATTDASGYYEFDNLALGTYTVTATADGYDQAVDSKDVTSASTYWKSMALEPATSTPDPTPTPGDGPGHVAAGGHGASNHAGCDVAPTSTPAPLAAFALLLLPAPTLLRRHD